METIETIETKVCMKCLKVLDIKRFHVDKRNGKSENTCKECKNTAYILYMKDNKEKVKQNRIDKRATIKTIVCNRCKTEKGIENFGLWGFVCYECQRKLDKVRRDKNKEAYKEARRKVQEKDPRYIIYYRAKDRAKEKGFDFTITIDDIVIPEVCPILGIPLVLGKGKVGDNSYSLDRIDSAKGYVKGNVRVISYKANVIKSNGTAEEHRRIAEYIEKNLSIDNVDYSI